MTNTGLQTSRSQTQQKRSSKVPALQIHSFLRMTRSELWSRELKQTVSIQISSQKISESPIYSLALTSIIVPRVLFDC